MRFRRIVMTAALCGSWLVSGLAQSVAPITAQSAEAIPAPQRVAADTPKTTPGGATFTVPAGWSIASGKNLTLLSPPETDTHITIFDSQATDAKAAVAEAWAAYKPESKRPIKLITPRPAREGWDERQVFE
jgi:hypothetical protein